MFLGDTTERAVAADKVNAAVEPPKQTVLEPTPVPTTEVPATLPPNTVAPAQLNFDNSSFNSSSNPPTYPNYSSTAGDTSKMSLAEYVTAHPTTTVEEYQKYVNS